MQASPRARSLPASQSRAPQLHCVQLSQDSIPRFTLVIASEMDQPSQPPEKCLPQARNQSSKEMGTVDDLFFWTNKLIDGLTTGDENRKKDLKLVNRLKDMTECQRMKIQQAQSFLESLQELDNLQLTLASDAPEPFELQITNELSKWDCIDRATRFYNALSADQKKFEDWIALIEHRFLTPQSRNESSEFGPSTTARLLCDFESDQGLISKNEIVRILESDEGSALVSGRALTTDRQLSQRLGLYGTLKSSIERQHHGAMVYNQTCDTCRAKMLTRCGLHEPIKISQHVRTWVPLIYLQPLQVNTKLVDKARGVRECILSSWENYMKETARSLMNLLFGTFKHWTQEKMDVDFTTINKDMKRGLKNFFRSLEGSLSSDWECEIHYELILQQLRLLQSGDNLSVDETHPKGGELSNEEKTERVGQLMLERRIIYRLLEKHQEMLQALEAANQGNSTSQVTSAAHSEERRHSHENPFEHFAGCTLELKDSETSVSPICKAKHGSNKSLESIDAEIQVGGREETLKDSLSDGSALTPPTPFNKSSPSPNHNKATSSLSQRFDAATAIATIEPLAKRYGSEPCILDGAVRTHHQANRGSELSHGGRYRSVELPLKGHDRCSRMRVRSFGQGSKTMSRTSYPLPLYRKPSPVKLAVVRPVGGMDAGPEVGYVVIMRPNFRERITTVLDTRRRKRVSIHAAIQRGIAGFHGDPVPGDGCVTEVDEEKMSEEEQKRRFFAYDTMKNTKLGFKEALKAGLIHYDSSSTEAIAFNEFAKSEWRGVKSIYHPLVYRIEQVRNVIERDGKLIRQKHNWVPFQEAVRAGKLDPNTAEYIVRLPTDCGTCKEVLRLSFAKTLAYGLVKAVPLRHCLIEKLPRERCLFA